MIIKDIFEKYINLISTISEKSSLENLDILFSRLDNHFESGGRIFFAGNGGSAAVSLHAATDLGKLHIENKLLNVISLNTNVSTLTALSNDYGFENVFVNVIKNFKPKDDDTLITISSSGNSKNIINILEYCNNEGVFTFSLNGFDGGKASKISQYSTTFNSKEGYYGPIEDLHMMVFHLYAHKIYKNIDEIE